MWLKRFIIILVILTFPLAGCKGKDKSELYRDGLANLKNGNSQGAIVLFKNALEIDPNFFEARLGLAQSYKDLARFEVAENEFQKVLFQAPDNLEALIGMNEILLQTDRSEQSLEPLMAALVKTPNDVLLMNLLGRAYAAQQQLNNAENIFSQVLQIDSENEQARMNLARLQIVKKNYSAARKLLNENLEFHPESTATRVYLARLLGVSGDRQGALAQFLEVFKLDNRNMEALYSAGLYALDLNELSQAEAILKTLCQYFQNSSVCDRLEGLVEFRKNNFDKAIVALQKSLQSQPDLLSFYFLGLSHYKLGQFEQAISQFQKGLDLEPEHVTLRINLAQTLLRKGRIDDCISELQKALHYDAENALAHSVLGSAYLEKGDFENAMDMLDRAAELDPELADAHFNKGIFNLKNGDQHLGEAELEKAVNISPELLNARLVLAAHYLKQENFAEAIQLLNAGLKGTAEDALVYNYLAAAYLGQNNSQNAVDSLRKSIQLAPDYPSPYLNLAAFFLKEGDYAQAVNVYQDALLHLPKNVPILLSLASLFEFRGEETRALELLRDAAATGDVSGISSLVRFYVQKKDLAAALKTIDESEKTGDKHPALLEMKAAVQLGLGQDAAALETLLLWVKMEPGPGGLALASYYLRKGDQKAALSLAEQLIADRVDSGVGHWLKAKIQLQLGRMVDARQSVADGLQRHPQSIPLNILLASIYQREGNFAQSEQVLNLLLNDQPNYFPAIFALGALKDRSGDKSQARKLYEKVLKINRRYLPALNNLAYLLVDNYSEFKEALDLATKAYRLMPNSPEIMDTLGYVLVKNNRFAEAVPLLEKAHEGLPDLAAVQLHLGMAYQGIGKTEKANTLLAKVLVAGSNEEVREARRILQLNN